MKNESNKLNVTKGKLSHFPNNPDWIDDENGMGMAHFRNKDDGRLFIDALNTHNATGYTPSELKQQKDELLEALREIKNAEHGTYKGTPTYLKKVASDAIDKLITKYSNNDTDK